MVGGDERVATLETGLLQEAHSDQCPFSGTARPVDEVAPRQRPATHQLDIPLLRLNRFRQHCSLRPYGIADHHIGTRSLRFLHLLREILHADRKALHGDRLQPGPDYRR